MNIAEQQVEDGRREASPVIDFSNDDEELKPSVDHSLIADLDALLTDGKTYLEAELNYQKSRIAFSGSRIKWAFVYGAAAFGFLHMALIAFVVGLVIAMTPVVGPWIAIAIVVGMLLLGAFIFIRRLRGRLREIRGVFEEGHP